MLKRYIGLCSLCMGAWFLNSCSLFDPKEEPVTFVYIKPFQVYDSSALVKSYAQPSTAFVYYNNQILGVFPLPAKVPLLGNAEGEIAVLPGVTRNGTSAYQTNYIPYYGFRQRITPNPGKMDTIQPVTGYRSNVSVGSNHMVLWNDDFETGMNFIKYTGDTSMIHKFITESTGLNGVGAIYLDQNNKTTTNISTNIIPRKSNELFLELSYKSTIDFNVGVALIESASLVTEHYLVGFRPKSEWTRVYVPLTETMNLYKTTTSLSVLIRSELQDGINSGEVLIDNVRIVNF